MSRAAEQRKRIKKLERERAKLESEFGSLVHRRQCLLLQNAILTAWCDAFTLVQASGGWMAPAPRTAAAGAATAGTAAQQQQDDDEAVRERFHELLREEITLLNELTARDRVGNCPLGAASSALPDPGPNTLSPGDPMAFFRNVVAEGPCPEAAAWTVHDVASFLRETTLLSSLYLSMVHASPHAASTGNRQQAIKELWDRHCRGLMSLIMLGRQDVAQALCTWNLETMDQRPEYGKAAEQLTTTLPARMHLTDLQRELIPAAIEVFDSLDAALQQQWKEVTAQMGAAAAAAESAAAADRAECGDVAVAASSQGLQPAQEAARAAAAAAAAAGGSSGSNGGSNSSSSSSNGTRLLLRGFSSRQEHLEVQQQLAARMKLVMAKQYLLALTMMSLIAGCLTYEQVTLISVMSWPHPVRPLHLGKAIAKYVAQELASSASGHVHGSGASDTHMQA